MDFSQCLRKIMREKNISQLQLADLTGIPQPTISQYLTGGRPGSVTNLIKIADVLNVTADQLLGRTAISKPYASRKEAEILNLYKNLNSRGQRILLDIGKALLYDPENTCIYNDN